MIAIVDYGMGNLRNVRRAIEHLGATVQVTSLADEVMSAEAVVLPGVGGFGEAVRRIDRLGLREAILAHVSAGKPLLGICLGMQLLFDASDESPGAAGLGIIAGRVRALPAGVKVPHTGWNDVVPTLPDPIFESPGVYYFVHSFAADPVQGTIAIAVHGRKFCAAVRKGNVLGVQFHPEKSHAAGLALFGRFLEQATPAGGP
jgi:glutamine amidotransferase